MHELIAKEKQSDPLLDTIVKYVIPKDIKGFAGRYIVLKLIQKLVKHGLMSANKASMLKQNKSPLRRQFKANAEVHSAFNISKIADKFFSEEKPPTSKTLNDFLNALEEKGVSKKRGINYLVSLLDSNTLKELKIAGERIVHIDVLTGESYDREGDNRMSIHITGTTDIEKYMTPDLYKRILLEAQTVKVPKTGYYPRGITPEGKSLWDGVINESMDAFKEAYVSYTWDHPKNEVLWAYSILTYMMSADDQNVVPFTGGTAEQIKKVVDTPEPVVTPEPPVTPPPVEEIVDDEDEEEDDADEEYAKLEKAIQDKFSQNRSNIKKGTKEAVMALKKTDSSARLRKESLICWSKRKTGFLDKKGTPAFYFIIARVFYTGKDPSELEEDWDNTVEYLVRKKWFAVGKEEDAEDLQMSNAKMRGNVMLSLQAQGVFLYEMYYFNTTEAANLTGLSKAEAIKKRMLDVAEYYKQNGTLPPLGEENLPSMKFKWS